MILTRSTHLYSSHSYYSVQIARERVILLPKLDHTVRPVQLPDHPPHFYGPPPAIFPRKNLSNTTSEFDIIISPEPYKVQTRLTSCFHRALVAFDERVEISETRIFERYLLWMCPVKKRWKTSRIRRLATAWGRLPRHRIQAIFLRFFPGFAWNSRISWNLVWTQDIIFLSCHTSTELVSISSVALIISEW